MQKILFTFILLGTLLHAKLNIVSSILPEQTLIQAIGGDNVSVALMVKPGNSPHTYEPKPSQMKDISHADLYLAIGVEFEKVWLPRFASQNRKMKIIDLSEGIEKLAISGGHEKKGEHHDPHIWTSPANIKHIAQNILTALSQADTTHTDYYQKNYETLIEEIERTDQTIRTLLKPLSKEQRAFIVFHPSWGYFAKAYGLIQIPIEIDGKAPKPRAVQKLISKARAEKIHTILTSPEFSDAVAKQIAEELHIRVLKISPLAADWSANLIRLAKTIADTASTSGKM